MVLRMLSKPVDIPTLLETVRTGLRSDRRGRLAEEFAEGPGPGVEDGPALVLIADDDAEVRGLLGTVLASAGYRIEEARDGEEAVEKALAHDVGLVLMDLNMPRMSGREAVKVLRRVSRDCFIICMTGECSKREMDAAGAAPGAVQKQIRGRQAELSERVRNRPRGGGSQMPTFGSEADAAAAAKAGKIKPGDRITINGQTGTWQ